MQQPVAELLHHAGVGNAASRSAPCAPGECVLTPRVAVNPVNPTDR
jgi:hypothetical protein